MNKTRLSLYLLLALTSGLLICAALRQPGETDKRKATLEYMITNLEQRHYSPLKMDDTLSERVYKMYLKRLDSKDFFTQGDMEQIAKNEYKVGSQIANGTFEFFDLVNSLYSKRRAEDSSFAKDYLSKPIDFTINENIELEPAKMDYAKDDQELHDYWRRYLKYQVMVRLTEALDAQDEAKKKNDTTVKQKTFAENESDARKKVLKNNLTAADNYFKETDTQRLSNYLNCITNAFDPHSEYFAPVDRNNFDITMSGQLEGIGAQLQDKSGNITITHIVPGSPAAKSGQLKDGDVIIKVGQGANDPVDITGMSIDKAIQLIRGKKGTEVRLTVKKPDNSIKVVTLIRDIIPLEDTFAHDAVIEEGGKKIGYIRLPEFYTNYEGTGSRTCFNDVRQELRELNAAGVDGLVMDLRDNGGGLLQDVVKMVGLFIATGPIVQVRGPNQISPMADYDSAVVFRQPLIVLVNGGSASASEIFAAAIQDYKRGIIMGSQTYGKGTVQQMFGLDESLPYQLKDLAPLGSVKITISKFYRINGGTTQKDGVTPDIPMPDPYQYLYPKEKDEDCPILSDKVAPSPYSFWIDPPDISKLQTDFEKHVDSDSIIDLIQKESIQFKKQRDHTMYTLNLDEYRKEQKQQTDADKKFDAINKPIPGAAVLLPDGKPDTKKTDAGTTVKGQLLSDNSIYAIYATGQEAQKMRSDTNEAKIENTRLKLITKDHELYLATQLLNEMK